MDVPNAQRGCGPMVDGLTEARLGTSIEFNSTEDHRGKGESPFKNPTRPEKAHEALRASCQGVMGSLPHVLFPIPSLLIHSLLGVLSALNVD